MIKEKQITEMARDQINRMVKVLEASCDEAANCSCNCDLCKATVLYNAGCRMQSEDTLNYSKDTRKSEWISVEERLPEPDKKGYSCEVLMAILFGKTTEVRYGTYREGEWSDWVDDEFHVTDKRSIIRVTHWMPLPEPPKGVTE